MSENETTPAVSKGALWGGRVLSILPCLLTAYMGGAIATHVRVGDPFIVQVLVGMAFWGGLWLRDPRLKQLIPITK